MASQTLCSTTRFAFNNNNGAQTVIVATIATTHRLPCRQYHPLQCLSRNLQWLARRRLEVSLVAAAEGHLLRRQHHRFRANANAPRRLPLFHWPP